MTVNYGTDQSLDHWVRYDPEAQAGIDEEQRGRTPFPKPDIERVVGQTVLAFSDEPRGGISERDRLGIPLNEKGERAEWPYYMDEDEGKRFAKLSRPAYWRKMGPEGRTSVTAVREAYTKLVSTINSLGVEYDQLGQDGDDSEKTIVGRRINDYLRVKRMIDEDPNTQDLRNLISRE